MLNPAEVFILRKENALLKTANTKLKNSFVSQNQKADRLEEENSKLKDELKKVKEELEKTKKQRDTYKGMIFKPNVSHTSAEGGQYQPPEVLARKELGGQSGHQGDSRKLPQRVDQNKRVFFTSCPNCGNPLERTDSVDTHTVEDIPALDEQSTIVSKYESERQWCSTCCKEAVATPLEVIPHSRLGINLTIQVLIWKYACRMPIGIIVSTLDQTYGIAITTGAVIAILKRAKEWFGVEYQNLLKIIRGSPVKHADETGWRIKGLNSWLWAFLTKDTCYYTIEETRGGGVAKAVLEDSSKDDVLVRDDYSGYKNLPFNQQACWAHLLRVAKELVEARGSSKQMRLLYQELCEIFATLVVVTNILFDTDERMLIYQVCRVAFNTIIKKLNTPLDVQTIQTRLRNQQKDNHNNYLTALLYDGVPLTNNLAERGVRPCVVVRKISGGSRSVIGAETFAVNMSIIQTIKMRNQPLIPTLHSLILKGALGNTN